MALRSQLPGSSPLPAGALARGVVRAVVQRSDALEELRATLAKRFGGETILLGSGTQALQTALQLATSLPAYAGTPVALPAYSCYDLVSAGVGAKVRAAFYDIDPLTLSPDWDSLDEVLGLGARVVVAGNLYGFPLDWGAARQRVEAAGGLLIEDAAQGVGSEWDGRRGGTFGDATVLSFGRGKGWTGGGGGALILRDERLTRGIPGPLRTGAGDWGARALVGSAAHWALGRPSVYGLPRAIPALALGETVYKPPSPVVPMSTVSATLVLETARAARDEVLHRRRAADLWREILPTGPWSLPAVVTGGTGAYLRFPIVPQDGSLRGTLLGALNRFGAAPGYPVALHDLDVSVKIMTPGRVRDLPGARSLASRLFTLPTHSRVGPRDRSEARAAFEALVHAAPRDLDRPVIAEEAEG